MNNMTTQSMSTLEMERFNRLAHRVNRLGMNLVVFDRQGKTIFQANGGRFTTTAADMGKYAQSMLDDNTIQTARFGPEREIIGASLRCNGTGARVLLVDTGGARRGPDLKVAEYCSRHGLDAVELNRLLQDERSAPEYAAELLADYCAEYESDGKTTGRLEKLGTELSQTYEQIVLLYNLGVHMKVDQSAAGFLQYVCDQLTQIVTVEGITIFLEKCVDGQKQFVLTAGSGYVVVDASLADVLQVHLTAELSQGKEALVDSRLEGKFKYNWPEKVQNILAVPLQGNEKMLGMLVATNVRNKPDFDSIDIQLFNSVAHQCTVFIENGRLFGDLKELFIGSLKALTSSIDAKDQYTRGHSERVAFISRWIGERLARTKPVSEEQIHHLYLSGLLHDIGKIGVPEEVLRKRGQLTDHERALIMAHPRIGASILSEIRQMELIVPGVLTHHERIDGRGYPQSLGGDAIPLLGRIISLADSFDAMTSKRVYRDAMSLRRACGEIRKGMGTQFDAEIAEVFLDSDVEKLWQIIQDGFIERWDYGNFAEYGTSAIGALIR